MKRLWSGLVAAIFAAAICAGAQTAQPKRHVATDTDLSGKIAALLAEPAAVRAHWGIDVTTMDGQPIYSLNEGQLFRPASNAKLFTTAAAMALLGPELKTQTNIYGTLDAATGVVDGDLVLVGGGDANFGADDVPYMSPAQRAKQTAAKRAPLADLAELADQLVTRGVKRVSGNVAGDDTWFVYEPYPEGWATDDLAWGYGAPVSALSIHDNELKLTVKPDVSERAPAIAFEPEAVPFYRVDASYFTTDSPNAVPKGIGVELVPGQRVLHVFGEMKAGAAADVEQVAVEEPALYAAMALRAMLIERGIAVDGDAVAKHDSINDVRSFSALYSERAKPVSRSSCPGANLNAELAMHDSPTLAQDVVATLKESLNLHAELMLHEIGMCASGPGVADASTFAGVQRIRGYAARAGVKPDELVLFDGSGLSTKDLVTPHAVTSLLKYVTKEPWFGTWKAALPIGGVDGTLASRFTKSPLTGKVFAKTGTEGETRALSGYLVGASGRTIIFSILEDTHVPGTKGDRDVMDRIVEAIAAAN